MAIHPLLVKAQAESDPARRALFMAAYKRVMAAKAQSSTPTPTTTDTRDKWEEEKEDRKPGGSHSTLDLPSIRASIEANLQRDTDSGVTEGTILMNSAPSLNTPPPQPSTFIPDDQILSAFNGRYDPVIREALRFFPGSEIQDDVLLDRYKLHMRRYALKNKVPIEDVMALNWLTLAYVMHFGNDHTQARARYVWRAMEKESLRKLILRHEEQNLARGARRDGSPIVVPRKKRKDVGEDPDPDPDNDPEDE